MKKALITGISGQDGAFLSKLLLQKGYKVYGTSRDSYNMNRNNLKILGIDEEIEYLSVAINDFRSIFKTINDIQPDEIYNLSGQSSVGLSFEQPVETFESIAIATINILESIKMINNSIKFYNAGSGECFGNTGKKKAIESDKFKPNSPYGVAKSTAFWNVKNYREAYNLYSCTGLLFNHESYLRGNRFVTKKIITTVCNIHTKKENKLILGNIDIHRDWGWAEEYVNAMHLMLQQEYADDYIIATGETRSLKDFIKLAFDYFNLDYKMFLHVDQKLYRPADIKKNMANPIKAKNTLSWEAKLKLEDIVTKMIKFELDKTL